MSARRLKYGNRKVVVDGETFDSMREANRWRELNVLQRAGLIGELKRQVRYELAPSVRIEGERRARPALRFTVDFQYVEHGELVIEDSKGFSDTAFRIRQHLMKSVHNLDVRLS